MNKLKKPIIKISKITLYSKRIQKIGKINTNLSTYKINNLHTKYKHYNKIYKTYKSNIISLKKINQINQINFKINQISQINFKIKFLNYNKKIRLSKIYFSKQKNNSLKDKTKSKIKALKIKTKTWTVSWFNLLNNKLIPSSFKIDSQNKKNPDIINKSCNHNNKFNKYKNISK